MRRASVAVVVAGAVVVVAGGVAGQGEAEGAVAVDDHAGGGALLAGVAIGPDVGFDAAVDDHEAPLGELVDGVFGEGADDLDVVAGGFAVDPLVAVLDAPVDQDPEFGDRGAACSAGWGRRSGCPGTSWWW